MPGNYQSRVVAHGPHRVRFDSERLASRSGDWRGTPCVLQAAPETHYRSRESEAVSTGARYRARRQDLDGVEDGDATATGGLLMRTVRSRDVGRFTSDFDGMVQSTVASRSLLSEARPAVRPAVGRLIDSR